MFEALLRAFAEEAGAGRERRLVLTLDNAGWRGEAGLAVPKVRPKQRLPKAGDRRRLCAAAAAGLMQAAALLETFTPTKKAPAPEASGADLSLVAGARNHRWITPLVPAIEVRIRPTRPTEKRGDKVN